MLLTYVDDCIIVGQSMKEIDELITSLQEGEEQFILTDEGDIDKFQDQLDQVTARINQTEQDICKFDKDTEDLSAFEKEVKET